MKVNFPVSFREKGWQRKGSHFHLSRLTFVSSRPIRCVYLKLYTSHQDIRPFDSSFLPPLSLPSLFHPTSLQAAFTLRDLGRKWVYYLAKRHLHKLHHLPLSLHRSPVLPSQPFQLAITLTLLHQN